MFNKTCLDFIFILSNTVWNICFYLKYYLYNNYEENIHKKILKYFKFKNKYMSGKIYLIKTIASLIIFGVLISTTFSAITPTHINVFYI